MYCVVKVLTLELFSFTFSFYKNLICFSDCSSHCHIFKLTGSVDDHMYSGNDAVSELSASLQGSLTLPSSNTSGGNNYYQQMGNVANNPYYAGAMMYNSGQAQQATVNSNVPRFNQVCHWFSF